MKSNDLFKKIIEKRLAAYIKLHHSKRVTQAKLPDEWEDKLVEALKTEINNNVEIIVQEIEKNIVDAEWYIDGVIDDTISEFEIEKLEDEDEWDTKENSELFLCSAYNECKNCTNCYHGDPHVESDKCAGSCAESKNAKCLKVTPQSELEKQVIATGGL
jgi:hypothetical protein